MAHKKAGGSSRNGRDSQSKRLGVKRYGGETVSALVQERGDNNDQVELLEGLEADDSEAARMAQEASVVNNIGGGYVMDDYVMVRPLDPNKA